MFETRMIPIYGQKPPCALPYRLKERRNKIKTTETCGDPENFITHDDSDTDSAADRAISNFSYNIIDYVRSREMLLKNVRKVSSDYGTRHLVTHENFKETQLNNNLGNINKIFCSQWLTDRQVVFGTKSNKLFVYDVATHSFGQIPTLVNHADTEEKAQCGIFSVKLNPSKTLLATSGLNSCDIAIYKTPTLKPVCVGRNLDTGTIFGICWLSDECLVSGSEDSKLSLWNITSDMVKHKQEIPTYQHIRGTSVKECENAQKVHSLCFNKAMNELAALSTDRNFHIWNAEKFIQIYSIKFSTKKNTFCMAVQDPRLYAVGCNDSALLLDCRTHQVVKDVFCNCCNWGICSLSFQGDILTLGTGAGMLMFYDVRANKYLESNINSSKTVILELNRGHIVLNKNNVDLGIGFIPAIFTHCYNSSGTRLFTAGGAIPSQYRESYASLWQ